MNRELWNTRNGVVTAAGVVIALFFGLVQLFSDNKQNTVINNSAQNQGAVNIQSDGSSNVQNYGNNNNINNSVTNNYNYSDIKDPNYLNERISILKGIRPINLVWQFYYLQTIGKYKDACSLLQSYKNNKMGCDSADGEQIIRFANWSQKLIDGYEHLTVTGSNYIHQTENTETLCVKYAYKMRNVSYSGYVWEINNIKVQKREDGEREIVSRTCEFKSIEGLGIQKHCADGVTLPSVKFCEFLK